jgi:outer membrane protein
MLFGIEKINYIRMKKYIWIVILFLFICSHKVSGQEAKWTLEDCINYAVTNNIELQRKRLQTEVSETDLLASKMNVLPDLNFGSYGRVGFGRSIDPVTNLITFKQNLTNSYTLSSNVDIFNGFTQLNTIAANKFMLKAGLENEKIEQNTLIVDIMGQFYQVLYTKGLENASKMQLDLSEKQLFRIQKMVETGKEALSQQYEIESQVSADNLAYTIAQNSSNQAVTVLKQMLQLKPGTAFDVLLPDMNSTLITDTRYNTDSIYSIALQTLPRLKAINYELEASKKQIAAARGDIAPSLSLGGAVYTGYFKVIGGETADQISFADQLKNNNSQAVYLSLNIPIFNKYTTGRKIKLAKIRKEDNELRLELEKNNLFIDIENACLNFNRGKDEFQAAEANYTFNKRSFNAVEKKFESGLVDVTDYSAAKTTLFKAETEELRTKLQLLIRKLTIRFYTTGEYDQLANSEN